MAWAARCGEQLIDLGNPLVGGQKLNPDGNSQGSTRGVAGYSINQAISDRRLKLQNRKFWMLPEGV